MIPFRASPYRAGDVVETAGCRVRLAVNARARRVSLRLDRTNGEVIAVAPTARKLSEAVAFARERSGWIAQRIAELPDRTPLHPGLTFTLFGDPVVLEAAPGRARLIPGEPMRLVSAPSLSGISIVSWLAPSALATLKVYSYSSSDMLSVSASLNP